MTSAISGSSRADALLDLARARVRLGERAAASSAEREEERRARPSVSRKRSSRGGLPVALAHDPLDRRAASSLGPRSPAAGLAQRLEVRLHRVDLRHRLARSRARPATATVVRLLERQVARQLQVQRELDAAVDGPRRARLWISRTPGRRAPQRARARAAPRPPRGSTWTTTSLPGSARCDRAPRPRRRRRAPGRPRRRAGRRSRRPRTGGRPPGACRSRRSSTAGSIAAIASRAASSASAGARSMSTSTFRRISRAAASSTSTATKSAATESPLRVARAREQRARRARRPSRRGRCRSAARSPRAPALA